MTWGAIGGGYGPGVSHPTLQERTCASILAAALTLAIFLAPLLISVERRVSIVGSLQVFVINSIEGEDAAPDERQRPDASDQATERRAEIMQQVADPEATVPEDARPDEPDPAPITLADLSQTLNGGEALVSLAPPILAEMGDAHAPPGERGVPGIGEGGGGSGGGDGGGGAGRSGRDLARVYTASWAPSMDFAKDHRHYPRRAAKARVEGVAWLKCRVIRDDRVSDCRLIGENPRGYGFGRAALKTAPGLRIQLHDQAGRRVYDEWTVVTSTFSLADLQGG
jgi:protein TonB